MVSTSDSTDHDSSQMSEGGSISNESNFDPSTSVLGDFLVVVGLDRVGLGHLSERSYIPYMATLLLIVSSLFFDTLLESFLLLDSVDQPVVSLFFLLLDMVILASLVSVSARFMGEYTTTLEVYSLMGYAAIWNILSGFKSIIVDNFVLSGIDGLLFSVISWMNSLLTIFFVFLYLMTIVRGVADSTTNQKHLLILVTITNILGIVLILSVQFPVILFLGIV